MPVSSRGRPPKPEALKKLQGTARKARAPKKLKPASTKPRIPHGLSPQARRIWKSLGPKLHELGLLAEVDASTFGVYCQAYGDWLELTRLLNKLGPRKWYQTAESGYRNVIPEVAARNTAFQTMNKLAPRFGLDPSSRSGIGVADPEANSNPVEEFLFQPRVIA